MREILKNFLRETWTLVWCAWTAPADQATDALWTLAALALQILIVFLVLRWLWRKLK